MRPLEIFALWAMGFAMGRLLRRLRKVQRVTVVEEVPEFVWLSDEDRAFLHEAGVRA